MRARSYERRLWGGRQGLALTPVVSRLRRSACCQEPRPARIGPTTSVIAADQARTPAFSG